MIISRVHHAHMRAAGTHTYTYIQCRLEAVNPTAWPVECTRKLKCGPGRQGAKDRPRPVGRSSVRPSRGSRCGPCATCVSTLIIITSGPDRRFKFRRFPRFILSQPMTTHCRRPIPPSRRYRRRTSSLGVTVQGRACSRREVRFRRTVMKL